jgi:hypothetical protein
VYYFGSSFLSPYRDSLEEKAKAYSGDYKAWQNIEASFHFHVHIHIHIHIQQGWADRLDSQEDIQTAIKINQTTLDKAAESFSIEELHSLAQKGLVASDELTLIESHLHKNQTTNESIIELRKKEIRERRKIILKKNSKALINQRIFNPFD